jgi:hypothetical protein
MAAASTQTWDVCDRPSWRLQHLGRVPNQTHSVLGSGGFALWTDVPPVGVPDPLQKGQMRFGIRTEATGLCGPRSGFAPEPFPDNGRRMVTQLVGYAGAEGKRAYPELSGARSTAEQNPRGLKRVESRARRDVPSHANPNEIAHHSTGGVDAVSFRPEKVKMFPDRNQVSYRAWVPTELGRSEYGDWNWNQHLGFRRVQMMSDGEPKRSESHPVAFPGYKGYPPDRQAGTNTRIDYALKAHGGSFTIKSQHPDVLASRANRAAASMPHSNDKVSLYPGKGLY